jgi:hypothetical protein
MSRAREDLVGDALQILYEKHGFKREQLFLQTKCVQDMCYNVDTSIRRLGSRPSTAKIAHSLSRTTPPRRSRRRYRRPSRLPSRTYARPTSTRTSCTRPFPRRHRRAPRGGRSARCRTPGACVQSGCATCTTPGCSSASRRAVGGGSGSCRTGGTKATGGITRSWSGAAQTVRSTSQFFSFVLPPFLLCFTASRLIESV